MKNNPVSGAMYLFKGFGMLNQPGIRPFVVVPLIINILVFAVCGWFMMSWLSDWIDQLMADLPSWLQWLDWLIWFCIAAASTLLVYFTFTIIANFISAPFNGVLAEAVEEKVTGVKLNDDSPWHSAIVNIGPAIKEEFNKLFYSMSRSLPFIILFFIPGVNIIASAAWLAFGAWMLSVQYFDYPLSNHNIAFKAQRGLLKQKRLLVFGFGAMTMFGTMIPIINFFILPSAVAGATLIYLDHLKEQEVENTVEVK